MLTANFREALKGISNKVGKTLGEKNIPPHFFTFLVLVFGLIAAYFIYLGFFRVAVVLILISGLMDFLDGAVAKANSKETKFGALFDSAVDKTTEVSWYLAFGFFNPQLWPAAFLAAAGLMLSSYVSKHAEAVGGKSGGGIMERKERLLLIVIGLLFVEHMSYILYIIAFFSFLTGLQRFFWNWKILWSLKEGER